MEKRIYIAPVTDVIELEFETLLTNNSFIDTEGDADNYDSKMHDVFYEGEDGDLKSSSYNVW
ncbi:MAG: hypothetical protein IKA00_15650 [Prevotella sp.]|nr:hypothetical protein [Prevotella sp.]MBR2018697.1 hypothetical protein [Prevotella sp.]